MTDTTETSPLPPAARRLYRPRPGRLVGGVAAGLGAFTDIDPVFYRVLFAVLGVLGGAGVLLYAIAWAVIPGDGQRSLVENVISRRTRPREWIVVALVAALLLATWGHIHEHRVRAVLVGIAVIGVVVAVVSRRRDAERPARTASPVTLPTTALAVLIAGLLGLLAAHGVIGLSLSDVLACALGVVLLGVVAASVLGRSLALIVIAVLLFAAALLARPLPGHLGWNFGVRSWTPTSVSELPTHYTLGAGRATLDLTQLPPGPEVSVSGAVGAGRLRIVIPAGSAVTVHAHAGMGTVDVFGRSWDGIAVDHRETDGASRAAATGPSDIRLDLSAGYGVVQVTRAAP